MPGVFLEMVRYFSQRMLNPYHGIVNVVEIEGADAVCRDGVHWMLYIQGGNELERSDDDGWAEVPLPDIKFGTWSRREGLKRAPVRYVTDYDQLDRLGSRLLDAVKSRAGQVPFPHGDRYELWLLDDTTLPLALLNSGCGASDTVVFNGLTWTPGQAARESFRCSSDPQEALGDAERLTQLVRKAAGSKPTAQWFLRSDDGSGIGLGCSLNLAGLQGRRLRRDAFPELLLRSAWGSPRDAQLVASFHSWQAPWLLALQTLSPETRRHLETAARLRAVLVDQLYPNYPEIIDQAAIKAARVEAALRRSSEDRADEDAYRTSFFVTAN
jgi:hypothetical protein